MFLEVNNLVKKYQTGKVTFQALKNTSFTMEQGQIGVILGPSGSGKSTLLNIIGGIDYADQGRVSVGGIEITQMSDKQLTEYRRSSVGFVFQFYNLIPNLTVYENIEVSSNITKDSIKIDEMLEAVGMKEFRDRFPRELSGGQQQRVSIARALIKKPKLLFCDEPTGALDYNTSKEILKLLQEVNRKYHTTILIITHNNAIAGIAHRKLRLRSGEIVEDMLNENVVSAERIEW
ncbi:ABC transporter ATP-binding protein [Anaerosacchariphilus polymeriproducens]|uniref:ABC transporter ATP-binding protein n=1 Tax=Anaerosacchariphilus polymeriproducens TaxID=1812858 RepID=A0A371AYX1_9FIRM|nr:ABC transporter ATP-binding protein [Anaerosacchariphilus polymeriproducens]RDU24680.1 ABC transporter ATP-binding protein [Anaerosacchariphilus polymeriproducens]